MLNIVQIYKRQKKEGKYMNEYTAVAIINVAIILLVAFGFYELHSAFPLLGLFFMVDVKKIYDQG